MYYESNGEKVRFINPISIRHLLKVLDTSYTNIQGTWGAVAKTTSLWAPLFHELGLLMNWVANAV